MSDDAENGFLRDETGGRSSARALLWVTVLVTLALAIADALSPNVTAPAEVWVLLGTIISGLILWAGGARVAQYAAPALGQMVSAIGQAATARNARLPSRQDDERGEPSQ